MSFSRIAIFLAFFVGQSIHADTALYLSSFNTPLGADTTLPPHSEVEIQVDRQMNAVTGKSIQKLKDAIKNILNAEQNAKLAPWTNSNKGSEFVLAALGVFLTGNPRTYFGVEAHQDLPTLTYADNEPNRSFFSLLKNLKNENWQIKSSAKVRNDNSWPVHGSLKIPTTTMRFDDGETITLHDPVAVFSDP